jgi:DNA-binding SARP family transcriptional activator
MIPWKLRLLGDCNLLSPSGPSVPLSTRKSLALLAYLALQPARRARRARVASLLWEEADAEQGRLHVRKALWLIRSGSAKAEPDAPPPIAADGDWLVVPEEVVTTDVEALVGAAAHAGDRPDALEAAADIYAGDFLGGFAVPNAPAFEDWAEVERQRIRETAVALLRRLVDVLAAAPDRNEAAMRAALRLLAVDPLQEHTHRAVMRLHVRQGRAGTALAHYHQLRVKLRRELDVDPEPQTQSLFQEIGATRRAPQPRRAGPVAPALALVESLAGGDHADSAREAPIAEAATPPRRSLYWRFAAGAAALAAAAFGLGHLFGRAEAASEVERIFPTAVTANSPAVSAEGPMIAFRRA